MPEDKTKTKTEEGEGESETKSLDFSMVRVNYQGREMEVAWPSAQAKAAGLVPCYPEGHPNVPDPTTGEISCGCGSKEVGTYDGEE